jgi:dolichyl-phosphate-mannose-protein mannosyltransferase
VTGYAHNDTNNFWRIVPTKALPETGRGRIVRNDDIIQLLHASTQSYLLTHDVASPTMPTNQEFTTWPRDDHSRHNDTLFQLKIVNGQDNDGMENEVWAIQAHPCPNQRFPSGHTTSNLMIGHSSNRK